MFVDVSYRGLKVAARARMTESGPEAGFIEVEAPLPVGTRLTLTGDATLDVRVVGVVEQESGAKTPPGMRVAWGEAARLRPQAPSAQVAVLHPPEPVAAPRPPAPAPAPAPTPAPAIVVVAPPAVVIGDEPVPEPAEPGASGGFTTDDSTGGGDGRRRRRKKTQIGRPRRRARESPGR